MRNPAVIFTVLACGAVVLAGCRTAPPVDEVVVYASVDQQYAEPVLKAFEASTGIAVKPVYDVEAAKTTGLVNRLLGERDRPLADVWWSGEFAQTVELARQGALATYESPSAADIPAEYRDPNGLWTGFGGRARVLLANTDLVAEAQMPQSIFDLIESSVPAEQIGHALPLFGTAATQAAALYAVLGEARAREYYEALRDRGIRMVDGNAVVRDRVADGQLAFGVTDTDDACGAIERGSPVKVIFPDQAVGPEALAMRGEPGRERYADAVSAGLGTLIVPNTTALVAGAPHPEAGKALIDYLLRRETTADLIEAAWFQLPLRPMADAPASCVDVSDVRGMPASLTEVARWIQSAQTDLATVFVR